MKTLIFNSQRTILTSAMAIFSILIVNTAIANTPNTYAELDNLNRYKEDINYDLVGFEKFNESISLFSGELSVGNVDLEIPGNGSLNLAVKRYYKQPDYTFSHSYKMPPANNADYLLGSGWNIHFGYVTDYRHSSKSRFDHNRNSVVKPSSGKEFTKCHNINDPIVLNGATYHIVTPEGRQEASHPHLSNDWRVTESGWRGGCAQTGFIFYSPEGHKYTFDKIKYEAENGGNNKSYGWYASKIEDKHGNTLTINYASGERAVVSYVVSSDSRRFDFGYGTVNGKKRLTKIYSDTHEVTYHYDSLGNLETVKRNGIQIWSYTYESFQGYSAGDNNVFLIGSITTETQGRYDYEYYTGISGFSGEHEPFKVHTKTTSGNLPSHSISYEYKFGAHSGGSLVNNEPGDVYFYMGSTSSYRNNKHTIAKESDRCTVYDYHSDGQGTWLSGQLARKKTYSNNSCRTLLETENYQYYPVKLSGSNAQRDIYAYKAGYEAIIVDRNIYKSALKEKEIIREGNNYKTEFDDFTLYGSPKTLIEHSSIGSYRTLESKFISPGFEYGVDLLEEQLLKDSNGNVENTLNYTFHPDYSIKTIVQNGVTNTFDYHSSGDLKMITYNGSQRYDLLESYYRGRPRKITQPCPIANTCSTANQSTNNTVVMKREINSDGSVKSVTDYRGNKTTLGYDDLSRLDSVDYSDTKWTDVSITFSYVTTSEDSLSGSRIKVGSLKQSVAKGNYRKVTYYDGMIRPVYVYSRDTTVSDRIYQGFEYDADGLSTLQTYPSSLSNNWQGVRTRFDALRRVLRQEHTADTSKGSTFSYLDDFMVSELDGEGNTKTTTYLEYGSPTYSLPRKVEVPDSDDTSIAYNAMNQATTITQGSTSETRIYDSNARLCKTIRPETGIDAYAYNSRNQISWVAEGTLGSATECDSTSVPSSHKTVVTYNALNLLHKENFPDSSPDRTYYYDESGNLEQLNAGTVVNSYTYNSLNLLESETLSVNGKRIAPSGSTPSLDYVYNKLGNLSSLTYPDGYAVSFSPDALGRPTKATRTKSGEPSFNYATGATFYANGQINTFNYGNGITHKTYLTSYQTPQRIRDSKVTLIVMDYKYTYDNNFNIDSITDNLDSGYSLTRLDYDGSNRLEATIGGNKIGSSTIVYDGLGNIDTYTSKNRDLSYIYDTTKNRLTSVSGFLGRYSSINYDGRGNVTNNGRHSFTYNRANQLINAKGTTNSYTYDGHSRRVKQKDGSGTSYSLYSKSGQLLYRETPDGGINYVYLANKLIAKDGHVEVRTGKMHYRPFGETLETQTDDVGYTGHKYDTDIGLSYMQARYYDPVIGRFYSNDPIGFRDVHSFNRYAYANNNPYKYIDPDGRDSIFIARPLSRTNKAQHGFAITTNVDSNGQHSLASRFSYGPVDQDGNDPLRNVTGSGDATDIADAGYANHVINSLNNGTPLPDGVFTSTINAADAVTEAVGNAIIGNDDYETVPSLQPGPGANSNSASALLGQMASGIAGNTFALPEGANLPGAEASNINNVQVNQEQLKRDLSLITH
ncbi:RHS repeat-associated core domain-containing protein [Alteromonas stellipolaris]|uniref:RHS repeat-associated core domain-containing protein n=1 Tax=Alteromonas stellipolaris TaxID=233316 RepID=A0ABN4LVU6_9ALTE|nr:hypothetical protein AVL57_01005 [Alteromonas stellipolaris]